MQKLIIDKQFDQQVWQTETEFDNEKYNEWLTDTAIDSLKSIYAIISDREDDIAADDVYVLGDVINMLEHTRIEKAEPRGEAWTVTAEDFTTRYDCSEVDDEQMAKMIDHVTHGMGNNDCMAECFWMHIDMEAEDNGLSRLED